MNYGDVPIFQVPFDMYWLVRQKSSQQFDLRICIRYYCGFGVYRVRGTFLPVNFLGVSMLGDGPKIEIIMSSSSSLLEIEL